MKMWSDNFEICEKNQNSWPHITWAQGR